MGPKHVSRKKPVKGKSKPKQKPRTKPPASKMGRPTLYRPEFCKRLVDYFSNQKPTQMVRSGQPKSKKEIGGPFPTFEWFAHTIDVNIDTLKDWTKQHPEFLRAYTRAKQIQKAILIRGAVSGLYQPQFSIFFAINDTDMRQKGELDITSKGKTLRLGYVERS